MQRILLSGDEIHNDKYSDDLIHDVNVLNPDFEFKRTIKLKLKLLNIFMSSLNLTGVIETNAGFITLFTG